MAPDPKREWVLPALIPFADLKSKDLEECVYWLLDAMGAKNMEWRTGGTGSGAADGGRDLEAYFFVPDDNGEMVSQKWWIECKGRSGTVNSGEVKAAVNNALAYESLDRIVIATNTQFSNPTRDWIKEWQKKHPIPVVYLWEQADLERLLSRHPDVVLRLFSEALSLHGRFKALDSKFWNKLEFVTAKTLAEIWGARESIDLTAMGGFALIANEFANGNIGHRPWGAMLDPESLFEVLSIGFQNVPYLLLRSSDAGIDQKIIYRTFAYLILVSLDIFPAEGVAEMILDSLNRGEEERFPQEIQEFLLMPIADQLLSEMQDVCSADCERIISTDRRALTEENDEIEGYWHRLEPDGVNPEDEKRFVRIESRHAPCKVGFSVDKDNDCPLFSFEPSAKNLHEFCELIKRVGAFRKSQATALRKSEDSSNE